MCASHVASVPRLKALKEMVASWRGQVFELPLRLSVSCEPAMAPLTSRVIERLLAEHGDHGLSVVYVGEARKSQFEHYRDLAHVAHVAHAERTTDWVMFSDDDDVWHPQRSLHVMVGIERVESVDEASKVLSVRVGGAVNGELSKTSDVATVDRAMDNGEMKPMGESHDEYWMFACRLTTLLDFVDRADDKLLKSLYCDMYLVRYFRHSIGFGMLQVPLSTTARWSYAYRRTSLMVRATTRDVLHSVEEQLALLYTRLPPGRQDAATREKNARERGMMTMMGDIEPRSVFREWSRLVDCGAMDAYAFSPMPRVAARVC